MFGWSSNIILFYHNGINSHPSILPDCQTGDEFEILKFVCRVLQPIFNLHFHILQFFSPHHTPLCKVPPFLANPSKEPYEHKNQGRKGGKVIEHLGELVC
jgi:hypothetical protein